MGAPPTVGQALLRGVRRRCPRCGLGPLYRGWYESLDSCSACGWVFERGQGDIYAFTYISTAFITGLIVVAMFLFTPRSWVFGWIGILVAVSTVMVGTMPQRRGVGVALDYLVRRWTDPPE